MVENDLITSDHIDSLIFLEFVSVAVSVSQVGQHMSMETTSQHAVQPVAAKRKRAQSL